MARQVESRSDNAKALALACIVLVAVTLGLFELVTDAWRAR